MKKIIKEYLWITFGVAILASGLFWFLFPSDLAVGGLSGFVMVVNRYFPMIPRGVMLLGFNVVLYILGFILIGKEFGGKTIYASLTASGMIILLESLFPVVEPLVEDIFLNVFFGVLVSGVGMAIVFYQNASSGGTDIIAKIINKFYNIDIGKSLLMADFTVVVLAIFAFGMEKGLYALLGIIMNSFFIDYMIEGFDQKYKITLISRKNEEFREFIIRQIGRGVTIYPAVGGYTLESVDVIRAVMSKREFIKLKKKISVTDPEAFFTVTHVREVFGSGFKYF
jgi:uncharacterized membrane-anchored protein YitT (DUF2179 family)